MKPPELFAALYQRFKLNLIRRAHNALYELGLSVLTRHLNYTPGSKVLHRLFEMAATESRCFHGLSTTMCFYFFIIFPVTTILAAKYK